MLLPSLVGCFIPASNAVLQASLSSAFFSLRQMVISSALGMNALQSLKTSGVHAKRCSSVPSEKEGAGQAIADSNASDTRHFLKGADRSGIHFIPSFYVHQRHLAIGIEVDTHSESEVRYTLAGARACSGTTAFVAFDPAVVPPRPKNGERSI